MADPARPSHPALVLTATGLGLFMIFLDATIVNVALPSIQEDFSIGESGLQWVVAAYSLTMGMFMMTSASIADRWGRRRTFVLGLVVFCGASLACALAPGIGVLNITRGLQGVGAAVVNVASLALVGAAYTDPAAKTRAVGLWTGIAAVGLAIGPTVGGVLTDSLGWRSIFVVNPVVGGIAIVLTYTFVRESSDPEGHSFDPIGQVLFIVAIGALAFALVEAPVHGFSSAAILVPLVGSAVVLVVFARFELRSRDPMMDVRVFANVPYTAAITTMFTVLFCAYGTLLVVTQYFQNIEGYSAERTGALLLAFSLPSMVMAPIAGRLSAHFGGRRPTLAGIASVCVGTVLLAVGVGGPLWIVLLGLLFLGNGAGLSVAPATAVGMASIRPERSGMASGILSTQRGLGSTAGFAVMGSVLAIVVASQLPDKLETAVPDPAERVEVAADVEEDANPQAVPSINAKAPTTDAYDRPEVVDAADGAFVDGIRIAELVGFLLVAATFVFGWFAFPRSEADERSDELAEAATLDAQEP